MPTAGWESLPPELRLDILGRLKNFVSFYGKFPMAAWSHVSKEWQSFFEPFLWQKLTFQPSIPDLGFQEYRQFVKGHRKALIRVVALNIQMEEHNCERCGRVVANERATSIENQWRASADIKSLLSFLRNWTGEASIAVELSATWPNTARHLASLYMDQYCRCPTLFPSSPTALYLKRDDIGPNLPAMRSHVVTALSVKRTLSWSISTASIHNIMRRFPRLEKVDYEQCLGLRSFDNQMNWFGNAFMLETANKICQMRRVSLWVTLRLFDTQGESDAEKAPSEFAAAVVSASFYVKEMALSHALDAREFFRNFITSVFSGQGGPSSSSLEHLVLTCHLGQLSANPAEVDNLLLAAGRAAAHMGCLRIMEVWSPGEGKGFFFRYEVEKSLVKLTVAATWRHGSTPWQACRSQKALGAWEEVASRHTDRRFECITENIDPGDLVERSSICRQLKSYHLLRDWQNH